MKSQVSIPHQEPCRILEAVVPCPRVSTWVSVVMTCKEVPAFLGTWVFSENYLCALHKAHLLKYLSPSVKWSCFVGILLIGCWLYPRKVISIFLSKLTRAKWKQHSVLPGLSNSYWCLFSFFIFSPFLPFHIWKTYLGVEAGSLFLAGNN